MGVFGFGILKSIFGAATFSTLFLGLLINCFENFTPSFVHNIYNYGKCSYNKTAPSIPSLKVPKRWFRHFYSFASIWSTVAFILLVLVYTKKTYPLPQIFLDFLDFFGHDNRRATVTGTSAFTAMLLLTVQCWRRFYETHFISVFSDSKMDAVHYFLGHFHYFGAVLAILMEAPGFTNNDGKYESLIRNNEIGPVLYLTTGLFMWAWLKQYESATILAQLRKNKKGEVVHQKHTIPHGGLFDSVSSPHLMCEIIMYLCLTFILKGNTTWCYVTFWVLSNQISTAILSHRWYTLEFENYPKNRKVLIPGIF